MNSGLIAKDVGLVITELQYTFLVLVWRVRGRTRIISVRIPALRVEIWHSLQNTILENVCWLHTCLPYSRICGLAYGPGNKKRTITEQTNFTVHTGYETKLSEIEETGQYGASYSVTLTTHYVREERWEGGEGELYKLWVCTRALYKHRTSAYDITVREVQFNKIPKAEHVTQETAFVTTVLNSNVTKPELIPSGFQFPLQHESK